MSETIHISEAELKAHFDKILKNINANNLYATMLGMLEFGEFLQACFPNTKLENIQKALRPYKYHFSNIDVPPLDISAAIFEAKTQVFMEVAEGADVNTINTLTNLSNGVNCFNNLLNDAKSAQALRQINIANQDNLIDHAREFLQNDLIPCTPERVKVKNAINSIKQFSKSLQGDHKEITAKVAETITKNSDAHFAKPHKTKADILAFQVNSLIPLNVVHIDMQKAGYTGWDITFKNAAIAIAGVVTAGVGFALAAGIHWITTGKAKVFCEAPELMKAKETFKQTKRALEALHNTGEETAQSKEVAEMVDRTIKIRRLTI